MVQDRPPLAPVVVVGQEVKHGVDHGVGGGAGEEVRPAVVDVVDEEAVHLVGSEKPAA